ncbi:hypothetical protein B566_EDAN009764 [Ephemera danica]|nr:hypothetical protein B566_EDAN009764 [Ephemera danica]
MKIQRGLDPIPDNAIIGGIDVTTKDYIYIGRAKHGYSITCGKVQADEQGSYRCYVVFGNAEHAFDEFEILVQAKSSPTAAAAAEAKEVPSVPRRSQDNNEAAASNWSKVGRFIKSWVKTDELGTMWKPESGIFNLQDNLIHLSISSEGDSDPMEERIDASSPLEDGGGGTNEAEEEEQDSDDLEEQEDSDAIEVLEPLEPIGDKNLDGSSESEGQESPLTEDDGFQSAEENEIIWEDSSDNTKSVNVVEDEFDVVLVEEHEEIDEAAARERKERFKSYRDKPKRPPITDEQKLLLSFQNATNGAVWNTKLYSRFKQHVRHIKHENGNDSNERNLFHGSPKCLEIVEKGFDERHASNGGMYGAGVYFAKHSSKSNQYAFGLNAGCGPHRNFGCLQCTRLMMLCRVALGKMHECTSAQNFAHAPPGHHSVKGSTSAGNLNYPEYYATLKIRINLN